MILAHPAKGCWGFYAHSPVEVRDPHLLLHNISKRQGTFTVSPERPNVLQWRDTEEGQFSCDYEFDSAFEAAVALQEYRLLTTMEAW